jgi:phosphoribosylformylglycinamidine synthase subunit PurSL
MAHRIEVFTKVNDMRSEVMHKHIVSLGYKLENAKVIEVYTIAKELESTQLKSIASMLANPVSQNYLINSHNPDLDFDFVLEIGFLPGVTDNIATTAKESIEDLIKSPLAEEESVHSSKLIFLKGSLSESAVKEIGSKLANELIQRIHVKTRNQYLADQGMEAVVPKVILSTPKAADEINLDISEEELLKLGKEGIPNEDGTSRGPLALEKDALDAITDYYAKEGRNPTDIELESLAQTWSEHCKHTIFAAKIDDNEDGLYKGYIKRATQDIRKAKGDKDFCVSVFSDNAGGIIFDDNWVITDKAETHNSPSALDPFGGAITGIVGVNRDCMGFGLGAKPVINKFGFCTGLPDDKETIYRDPELTTPALSPRRILDGIVEGVEVGGNCSGIPTPQGFMHFHKDYKGKPLVFVGTVGLIPREINGKNSWEKAAQPGDKIVVIGGRVGQDGIHGATFSSEALSAGSPATAVQIGDPITQKKASDAVIKEARDLGLYNSITDNGAGGISCSIAEMAKECGGCKVELDKVPLKYPNLEPWKIWISESQERMTLSIPEEKLQTFLGLMQSRGVEAAVVGEFTAETRCQVSYHGKTIMDLEMDFLHEGLPRKELKTVYEKTQHPEADFPEPENLTQTLCEMLERPNLCSFEYISRQYDHNVQGGSVLKPLQGKGKVNAKTSITKPFPESTKGVICSQGINANYSFIDTYHMAASAIDTAVRNIIAVGGSLDHLALMDNFCWCSSNEQQRLGELKAAAEACYDYAVAYGAPYISGKDSMFNDFRGFDKNGEAIKISAPPTLLVSSIGVIPDVTKAVSLDPKMPGDLIYVLGETKDELGGSEYFDQQGFMGNSIPQVDAQQASKLYRKLTKAIDQRLIASCLSPSLGGLGITLAKKAIAGQLGMELDFCKVPFRADHVLFSESQSRFVVTLDPKNQEKFETLFEDVPFALLGTVTNNNKFTIKDLIDTDIETLNTHYRKTFKNF